MTLVAALRMRFVAGRGFTFYKAKVRRKPVRIARTLVSLEIARIVYQVLKNHEDFNGRFKNQQLSRRKQSQWPRLASPAV